MRPHVGLVVVAALLPMVALAVMMLIGIVTPDPSPQAWRWLGGETQPCLACWLTAPLR